MANQFKKCPFCDTQAITRQVIFENDKIFIIYCRSPLAKGHTMIIPKRHVTKLNNLSLDEVQNIFLGLKTIIKALKATYDATDFNFFINQGKRAGQHISHLHFHLLPRLKNEQINPFKLLNEDTSKEPKKHLFSKEIKMETQKIVRNLDKI